MPDWAIALLKEGGTTVLAAGAIAAYLMERKDRLGKDSDLKILLKTTIETQAATNRVLDKIKFILGQEDSE